MNTQTFPRMHVSLYVSDLQKTTDFYTSFFSVQPVKVKPFYAKYILEQPSLIISFIENKGKAKPHFGHLGFQVETPEILQEYLDKANAAGLISKTEMNTTCCYAKQDKFWVNDPDGVQWEVYYFHEDAEFNDPHYEKLKDNAAQGQEISTCCMPADKSETAAASCC